MSENLSENNAKFESTDDVNEMMVDNKPRSRGFLYFLIFLLFAGLGAAGAGGWWGWQQIEQKFSNVAQAQDSSTKSVENTLNNRLQDQESQTQKQMIAFKNELEASLVKKLEAQSQAQQANLQKVIDDFAAREKLLLEAVQKASGDASQTDRDWKLSEIEYLLSAAQARLTIAGDVKSAEKALRSVLERIKTQADLLLLPLQEAVMENISELMGYSSVDYTQLASELKYLAANTSKLKRKPVEMMEEKTSAAEQPNTANTFLDQLLADPGAVLLKVVKIEDANVPESQAVQQITLPTEVESMNPAQALYLQLVTARMSALNQDVVALKPHVDTALSLLEQAFVPEAKVNQNMQVSLKGILAQLENQPQMPTLSKSIEALQAARQQGKTEAMKAQQTEDKALMDAPSSPPENTIQQENNPAESVQVPAPAPKGSE